MFEKPTLLKVGQIFLSKYNNFEEVEGAYFENNDLWVSLGGELDQYSIDRNILNEIYLPIF